MIIWNSVKHLLFRIEAVIALTIAWALVFIVPLRVTARLFGAVEAPSRREPVRSGAEARSAAVIRRMERQAESLPWRSTCLVRALAGALLLRRRGIIGTAVRFGVRKTDGRLEAHAWLLLGDTVLSGDGVEIDYLPLADFVRPSRH